MLRGVPPDPPGPDGPPPGDEHAVRSALPSSRLPTATPVPFSRLRRESSVNIGLDMRFSSLRFGRVTNASALWGWVGSTIIRACRRQPCGGVLQDCVAPSRRAGAVSGLLPGGGRDDRDRRTGFVGAVAEPMRYGRVVCDRVAGFEDVAFPVEVYVLLAGDHDHELLAAMLERCALGRRTGRCDHPDRFETSREVRGQQFEDGVIAGRLRRPPLEITAGVLADDRRMVVLL